MGCCILGAIMIARCIETVERVQRFFAPVSWLLRAVTPRALGRGKPLVAAAVIAGPARRPRGWAHADHILAALQFAGRQIAGSDIPAALCVGAPEIAAGASATPRL